MARHQLGSNHSCVDKIKAAYTGCTHAVHTPRCALYTMDVETLADPGEGDVRSFGRILVQNLQLPGSARVSTSIVCDAQGGECTVCVCFAHGVLSCPCSCGLWSERWCLPTRKKTSNWPLAIARAFACSLGGCLTACGHKCAFPGHAAQPMHMRYQQCTLRATARITRACRSHVHP